MPFLYVGTKIRFFAGKYPFRIISSPALCRSVPAPQHADGRPKQGRPVLNGVQNAHQLVAQEDGDHGGRRFVGAQTVVVACGGHAQAEQILIIVHGLDDRTQKQQELGVFVGRLAGGQQIHAGIGGHGPVVVLAGAVDTGEGLLMQQAHQTVLCRDLLHDLHGQLVVVGGDVGGGVNGRQLMLGGGDLVMFGLGKDTQLPQLFVQIFHVSSNAGLDDAEVVVIHLLPLGGFRAEQGSSGEDQILALLVHFLIHKEIFLLGTDVGADALDVGVAEELQDTHGLTVQGFHGAQQRGLLIQRLAAVGAERRGDAKGLALDECVGGGVPCGVSTGLKGGAQAAGGERAGVRLALDQLFAGEIHDDAAVGSGRNEAVVLFGGDAGQRLEPVGIVGRAMGDSPVLHGSGHRVGDGSVQLRTLVDGSAQRRIHVGGKIGFHHPVIKYQTAEIVRNSTHNKRSFLKFGFRECPPEPPKIKKYGKDVMSIHSETSLPSQWAFYTIFSHLSTPCTKKVFCLWTD